MSTIVHDVIYSASGGVQAATDADGYSLGQGAYSGGSGYSMCTIPYQHQQHTSMKPVCEPSLVHHSHTHGYAPDMQLCQQHYAPPDPGVVQHLQLPLTEPLLQQQHPHQQQQQHQQHVIVTSWLDASSPQGMLAMCQSGGSGGGGGGGSGGGGGKKRRSVPTAATGRRSLKTERVNPEESQRREKRRERNRVAAAKCRKKRQDRIECLSEAVRDLESDNAQLETSVSQLLGRRGQLVGELRAHRLHCPDSAELAAALDALPPAPQPPPPLRPPPQLSLSATTGSGGNSTDGFGDVDDESESCPSRGGVGGFESSFGSVGGGSFEVQQPPVDAEFTQRRHQFISGATSEASAGAEFMRL